MERLKYHNHHLSINLWIQTVTSWILNHKIFLQRLNPFWINKLIWRDRKVQLLNQQGPECLKTLRLSILPVMSSKKDTLKVMDCLKFRDSMKITLKLWAKYQKYLSSLGPYQSKSRTLMLLRTHYLQEINHWGNRLT